MPSPWRRRPTAESLGGIWLGRLDSNQGMAESKSAALPLGYAPIGKAPSTCNDTGYQGAHESTCWVKGDAKIVRSPPTCARASVGWMDTSGQSHNAARLQK